MLFESGFDAFHNEKLLCVRVPGMRKGYIFEDLIVFRCACLMALWFLNLGLISGPGQIYFTACGSPPEICNNQTWQKC